MAHDIETTKESMLFQNFKTMTRGNGQKLYKEQLFG